MFEGMHPAMAAAVTLIIFFVGAIGITILANLIFGAYFRQKARYFKEFFNTPTEGNRNGEEEET